MSERPDSPRRWAVLAALMGITLACEAEWLVHAAVARPAAAFYAGQFDPASLFNIDSLALSYMLVFLAACLPASWVLERWGLGAGVGVGAVLTAAGALGKAFFARSFAAQLGFQLVLALAQPFLTNAATTLARQWFRPDQRATAGGLASLAQYLGFVAALGLTPALVQTNPTASGYGAGLEGALGLFAVVSVIAAAAALALVRQGPWREPSAPAPFWQGVVSLFRLRNFRLTLFLFFLGLGLLNAVTSLTDSVAASLGFTDSDGLLGLGLIGGGVVAAVAVPLLSDRARRRRPFLVACMAAAVPALAALAWMPGGWPAAAVAAMALLGAALMSSGPIGFQYAAETTVPVPESTSQGVLLLSGQISGLVFTAVLSLGGPAAMRPAMAGFALMAAAMAWMATRLGESPVAGPLKSGK